MIDNVSRQITVWNPKNVAPTGAICENIEQRQCDSKGLKEYLSASLCDLETCEFIKNVEKNGNREANIRSG